METQKRNAKTPAPSAIGTKSKKSGVPGNGKADKDLQPAQAEQDEEPAGSTVTALSDDQEADSTVSPGETVQPEAANEPPVQEAAEEVLSPILAVSQRFMVSLKKVPWKGIAGRRTAVSEKESGREKRKEPASHRLHDWDTRLFVLSTLKRMVDSEHFDEMEEEDSRFLFTREGLHVRNQLMAEKDKRLLRRKQKVKKHGPNSRLGESVDTTAMLNTREKQRLEISKQLKEHEGRTRAGMALSSALQKATFIKETNEGKVVEQAPPVVQNDEINIQNNEATEQNGEVKEQLRQKRGFFNFNVKL